MCDDGYGISYIIVGEDIGMYIRDSVMSGFGNGRLISLQ